MNHNSWKETVIWEKMQIIIGAVLVFCAIILYFLAFIMTLSVGFEVVSAGATLLATGLAFFGITSFVKNQMVDFEARVNDKIKKMEEYERKQYNTDNGGSADNQSDA